ncbi:MAG: matrixin family metalloprotease [Vicinamibacterales bacterium]
MKIRQLTSVVAAMLVTAVSAGAYVLNGPAWGVQQVPYYINPVNADMSEDAAIAAIQTGAMNWTSQSNANILPYYMGRTTGSSISRNNKNEVFFRDTAAGSLAAETYWWYDGSYKLVEADILIYDGGFTFFGGDSGCSGGLYLQDITTHEFGHALGLGHSGVATATMYPVISWCGLDMRTLDNDDQAGIEQLYPSGGATNTPPSVSIIAPLNGSSIDYGAPVTFSGSASDNEDGNLTSSMVWLSSLDGQIGTGATFARSLSSGSHVITARVTDSKGATSETQRSVTVSAPPVQGTTPPGITLSARAYKVKGLQKADLTWSGSDAAWMDVYRNGTRVAITSNSGRYTDPINAKGSAAYTYVVCNSTTTTCSGSFIVSF